jgi:hypothetical protein
MVEAKNGFVWYFPLKNAEEAGGHRKTLPISGIAWGGAGV